MYTPDFFHNIRCLKQKKTLSHKQFFLYSILCISSCVEMNDLSLSSSPQFFSVISWKVFLCRKTPPNSPLVHIKSKWKKEWPEVGGLMEGDDRQRYICVCEAKVEQKKWNIYAVLLNVYCFLSSISLRLLHLINFTSSGKLIFETLMHSNSCSHALNHL